eukprot:m.662412 g.662412  ORF g.662412 m.662412 type:complete len:74 (+) comp58475_c0_seq2:172-393(+)
MSRGTKVPAQLPSITSIKRGTCWRVGQGGLVASVELGRSMCDGLASSSLSVNGSKVPRGTRDDSTSSSSSLSS